MSDSPPPEERRGSAIAARFVDLSSFADLLDVHRAAQTQTPTSPPELHGNHEVPAVTIALVLLYASWNGTLSRMLARRDGRDRASQALRTLADELTPGLLDCLVVASVVQIDTDDESMRLCIGDDALPDELPETRRNNKVPLPPSELPCLALVVQHQSMPAAEIRYVRDIAPQTIADVLHSLPMEDKRNISLPRKPIERVMDQVEADYQLAVSAESCRHALRIFVAGDRSSVGKSSVCLGLLGTLLRSGAYRPSDLAYVKPATQSESVQLIQLWCEKKGVACVPVGPLVYYRGFTRAYLAGETPRSPELLHGCASAVDRLARGRKVVVVDGVGFPAVGSICGTDNPTVARACSYPRSDDDGASSEGSGSRRSPMGVVLVGGPGVGAAVDAFNLNATYFETNGVPVLGPIFNKLELSGFYSLESCRREVTSYFEQRYEFEADGAAKTPFGFLPMFPSLVGENAIDHVDDYIQGFERHVDVKAIIDAARRVKDSVRGMAPAAAGPPMNPSKRAKVGDTVAPPSLSFRSRLEIEQAAINAGAAPSA